MSKKLEDRGQRTHEQKESLHERLHQLRDTPAAITYFCPKERFPDDYQSKRVHFLIEIQCLAGFPAVRPLASTFLHDRGDILQITMVENRLDQFSLLPMKLTLTGQQPFAQQRFRTLQSSALMKIGSERDQHFANQIGRPQIKDLRSSDSHRRNWLAAGL